LSGCELGNICFKDAAERFQEEAGISADMDLSLLDNRIKIRDYIQVFDKFKKKYFSS
jgi:hypothetical protein